MTKAVSKPGPKSPTKFTEETVQKLEQEFMAGQNVISACKNAGISTSTYYNYLKVDQDFMDRMDYAEKYPNSMSRRLIVQKIKNRSDENARWWLSRRDPDFQPKPNTQVNILNQNMIKEIMKDEIVDGWSI